MQLDARSLADFYEAPVGQVVRRTIFKHVRTLWPARPVERALGFGFAVPYLRPLMGEARHLAAFMPAQCGVVAWPAGRPLTVLGEEFAMPFPDAFFDFVLMVHALESAEAARPLMRQIWRVMAPEGRLVIVAPNRTSPWSLFERSPFASGRPFSRRQLDVLLHESLFTPDRWESTLFFPPFKSRRLIGTGQGWDRAGKMLWPQFAGVHIVAAVKSLFAVSPAFATEMKSDYVRA